MVEKRSRKERLEMKARRLKAKFLQEFLAPERLILLSVPVLLILFLFGSITSLSKNWGLRQEIHEREAEVAYLELQVESNELENQYYASEEYQELAARRLQNKKLSGETLVYLPQNTERARMKHRSETNDEKNLRTEKTNFEQWLSFLFNM